MVGLGGRVQPVDGLGGDGDGRVEPEGDVGPAEVVVDRLGDADHRDAVLMQPVGDAQRPVAADADEGVDLQVPHRLDRLAREVLENDLAAFRYGVLIGVGGLRGAEDRPAESQDPGDVVVAELAAAVVDEAFVAVDDADDLETVLQDGVLGDGPDDGVDARGIPPARKNSDPLGFLQSVPPSEGKSERA